MSSPARLLTMAPDEPERLEEERIRQAYERRRIAARAYSWLDPAHLFTMQDIERRLLAALRRYAMVPLESKQILEIGCGNGHWLREFVKWGARPEHLAGIDLLSERIAQACRLSPPGIALSTGNAAALHFVDGRFDIVFQATVFTSMLDPLLKRNVAAEMLRVLRPGGVILWYDFCFNNPRNPDVRGIKKNEIQKLFPGCDIALRRITLAPPIGRAVARRSWLAAQLLGAIPWARTHYLGAIQKHH
jgi:ubiquinone/menaquinone biosynthesis C-methylase UbiE